MWGRGTRGQGEGMYDILAGRLPRLCSAVVTRAEGQAVTKGDSKSAALGVRRAEQSGSKKIQTQRMVQRAVLRFPNNFGN